jgi:hypothetical protein
MARISLIALVAFAAATTAATAAAQESSTSPAVGGAPKAPPPLNDTQGAPPTEDHFRSHRAPDDKNANPNAAVSRGEIDESSIKSLLQSKGYADVRDLKRSGDVFTATAYKDNRVVRVSVDARTGNISDTKL